MKKYLLICSLIFLSFYINGQEVRYGISIGNVSATAYSDGNTNFNSGNIKSAFNFHGGFYVDYHFNNHLGINSEFVISNKHLEVVFNFSDSHDINLTYIDLSPNLKYDFKGDYFRGGYLIFGPRISYLISTKSNIPTKQFFNKIDFGVQFGLGGNLGKYLTLQGKVDYGISNILKDIISKNKQNYISFIIALKIDLDILK